jgi:hypothetical protein
VKDRFYGELDHVFDKLPKYHMKILLGDFNAKVSREFNQQLGTKVYTILVTIKQFM